MAETREELALARRYDSTWPSTDFLLSKVEILDGHFNEAMKSVNAGIALQPNRALGYFVRGDIHWQQGERTAAASDWLHGLRLSDVDEAELERMQNAFRTGGSTNFVNAYIEWLEGRLARGDHGRHFELAKELARLGRHEDAINHLDRSLDDREVGVLWVNVSPEFRGLRDDPRFHDILRRLGFPRR